MIDLGPYSVSSHAEVGEFARQHVDHLLTLGDEAKPLSASFAECMKPAEHFTDKNSLVQRLKELMTPGDVVLVKGSRDLALETVFDQIKES
jgi:UDP-N-acetylmuramoyl-tripeptide--D-alanyl-D-alanine ligase